MKPTVTVYVDDQPVDELEPEHREWLITRYARRWAEQRFGTRSIQISNANDPADSWADADLSPAQTKGSIRYDQ